VDQQRFHLSIVVPAFREALYIGHTLDALLEFLNARALLDKTEVVVVTADGPDDTVTIATHSLERFPHQVQLHPGRKVGKGRDVRAGMLRARGEFVVFMDADLATPLHHLDPMLEALRRHDLVIGYRDLKTIHVRATRTVSSRVANMLVQTLLLPGILDSQCGFKGFRSGVVNALFEPLATMTWGFDIEILVRARRLGLSIQQLPVFDWHDPKGDDGLAGEIQWAARLRTLRELISLRLRFGRPR
jgi:dolichyl-phosphate beta-glucosyltransferase